MSSNTAKLIATAIKRLEGRKTQAQVAREAGFPRPNMLSMIKIVPFIGRDKLSKLNVPSIRALEDRLQIEGRSPGLVKKVLVALGM